MQQAAAQAEAAFAQAEQEQEESDDAEQPEAAPAEETPVASEPQPEEQDVNCGIELKDWKEALEGKVTCGECNSPIGVGRTPGGVFVLFCQGSKKDNGCSQTKAMAVKQFADKFLVWFEAFFGERPAYFSLEDFNAKVESVTIKDKECNFIAKLGE